MTERLNAMADEILNMEEENINQLLIHCLQKSKQNREGRIKYLEDEISKLRMSSNDLKIEVTEIMNPIPKSLQDVKAPPIKRYGDHFDDGAKVNSEYVGLSHSNVAIKG